MSDPFELLFIMRSDMVSRMPNVDAKRLVDILSFHCWYLVMPKTVLTQQLWNIFKRFTCGAFSVQVSAPCTRTDNTTAQRLVPVATERFLFWNMGLRKHPKV